MNKTLYCINNKGCYLTIGKGYTLLQEDKVGDKVCVKDDRGNIKWYIHSRFTENETMASVQMKKNNNPGIYFDGIKYTLEMRCSGASQMYKIVMLPTSIDIPQDGYTLRDINNEYIGCINISSTRYKSCFWYTKQRKEISLSLKVGDEINLFSTSKIEKAITFLNEFYSVLNHINKNIRSQERLEEELVYLIEHKPDDKILYAFKSKDKLNIGDLVICSTKNGDVYGVVKELRKESYSKYKTRKECWRV